MDLNPTVLLNREHFETERMLQLEAKVFFGVLNFADW